MEKSSLGLAKISKAEFVYDSIARGPIVTQVPLLETIETLIAESGHIGAPGLESGEGLAQIVVVEIIIGAKLLFIVDPVIEAEGDLIIAQLLNRDRREKI